MRSLERLSILLVMLLSITASLTVFILQPGLTEFPQFGKKMPHKIHVAGSNWAQKKTQVLSTIFF